VATVTVRADLMRRWLLFGVFVGLSAVAPAAEQPEQLDGEFLEYLANLEGDDDDWTLIAVTEEARPPARRDADEPPPIKAPTKADPPATDER